MGAGLLYAAIIVGWAAYLIPHALRRYDEASRSRSIDRFSSAMRVLGRKPSSDAVATVKASGPAERPEPASRPGVPHAADRVAARAAARAAARRRRHVFAVLMLSTSTAVFVAALAYLPWWPTAIPAALTLLYLYACARRVRRESDAYWERAAPVARPATRVDTAYGSPERNRPAKSESPQQSAPAAASAAAGSDGPSAVGPDDEPTVILEQFDRPQVAVTVETSDGDVLWDPVPVTLPTYVSKPRARRTIRTIDLDQPGTWTSGNTEEASALVEQAAEAEATEEAGEEDRRAVGS